MIILNNNKLIEPIFLDWFKNLKIVLRARKIAYVLNRPLPQSPSTDTSDTDQSAYQKHITSSEIASWFMLSSMTTELQIQHETIEAYDIIIHLRELFDKPVRSERFEISKLIFSTKMQLRISLVQHALKMNTYIEILGQLGFVMGHELRIDLILSNLTDNFV